MGLWRGYGVCGLKGLHDISKIDVNAFTDDPHCDETKAALQGETSVLNPVLEYPFQIRSIVIPTPLIFYSGC